MDGVKVIQNQYPRARLFELGNDRGDDPAVYHESGGAAWIRNVSADQNYEANVWTADPSVVQKVDADLFERDKKQSYPVTDYQPGTLEKTRDAILRRLEKTWL